MTYRERLYAPLSWWIAAVAFAVVWGWLFLVATTATIAIVVTSVVAVLVLGLLAAYGRAAIVVTHDELRVGPAHISRQYLEAPTTLAAEALRATMGPQANARAFAFTRPYVKSAVLVPLSDERDPAPYWLITTRHPARLATALDPTDRSTAEREGSRGEEG